MAAQKKKKSEYHLVMDQGTYDPKLKFESSCNSPKSSFGFSFAMILGDDSNLSFGSYVP